MKMGFVAFARLYLEMRTLDGACTLIEKEKKVIQISSKRKKETNAKKVYTHVHALNSRMHLRGPMCLSRGVKGIFLQQYKIPTSCGYSNKTTGSVTVKNVSKGFLDQADGLIIQ